MPSITLNEENILCNTNIYDTLKDNFEAKYLKLSRIRTKKIIY